MKNCFLIIVLAIPSLLWSQNIRITGTVYDSDSQEKLIGAEVYEFFSQKGTVTNEFGLFNLSVPYRDTLKLGISYLGYKTEILYLTGNKNYHLKIQLKPGEELDEVIIEVNAPNRIDRNPEVSKTTLNISQIQAVPSVMSEPDLIKVIQRLPGVQPGVEGFSGMYVRGGSIDQNLILLDDVPLYYVNHLGGFLSVFNTDAINQVTLYKAGFPAKYGNRLSSVLDIRMRDGNKKSYHGGVHAGILSWKFNLEGPIVKNKTSFIISARRFPYDLLTRLIGAFSDEGSGGYTFYDMNAKLNHRFSEKDQIYLSWYLGDDAFSWRLNEDGYKSKSRVGWGNHMLAFKWAHVFENGIFMNTTASYTRYRFGVSFEEEDRDFSESYQINYYSGIKDYGIKSDLEWEISEKLKFTGGAGYVQYHFIPGTTRFKTNDSGVSNDTVIGNLNFYSSNWHAYLSARYKFSKKWEMETGIRGNLYLTGPKTFQSWEPRINFKYQLNDNSSVKISYMKVNQNLHLLTSGGLGTPVDLWMPATALVPPGMSWQVTGGYYRSFNHNLYALSVEAYYKEMNNQITYKPGTSFFSFSFDNWENLVEKGGNGKSYGVEIYAEKKRGKWTGMFAYTWSKSLQHFRFINNGKPYPFRFDRRHSIDLSFQYQIKPNVNFSAAWTFGSGYPFSLPIGKVSVKEDYTYYYFFIYKEKNNYRMRAYHRLDVSMQFHKKKRKGERTWTIGIFNVYNRQNPVFYDLDYSNNGFEIVQISFFPFIPSVSYTYKF